MARVPGFQVANIMYEVGAAQLAGRVQDVALRMAPGIADAFEAWWPGRKSLKPAPRVVDPTRRRWIHWLAIPLPLVAYVIAGKAGLTLAVVHPSATPVWPPTGIALAAFLLLGYGVWPRIALGAFLVNVK